MVAPLTAWIWMGLASSTLLVQHIVKPRLPVYNLKVQNIPLIQWLQGEFKTRLRTDVSLHNDNYLHIDVHALSFDVFYPDWSEESLSHIGRVQDRAQAVVPKDDAPTNKQSFWKRSVAPLWQIHPRTEFSVTDDIYMVPSLWHILCALPCMIRGMWRGGGTSLIVPTTGVAHIRASGSRTPLTVSFVCDNRMETFQLSIQGFDCSLHSLQPGWVHLERATDTMRVYAHTKLHPESTGGILPHAQTTDFSTLLSHLAWEEAMQIL